MKKHLLTMMALLSSVAAALTPEEFQQLYESKKKTAAICYQLYEAYAKGDGVEADERQARKWLLAAHDNSTLSTREKIADLPWRKKAKLKPSLKIDEVSDEEARALGRELVEFMLQNGGRRLLGMQSLPEDKPSRELLSGVRKLISQGADLNVCVTEQGDMVELTALYLACKMGDTALIDLLLNHGADPNFHGGIALEAFYFSAKPKIDTAFGSVDTSSLEMNSLIKKSIKRNAKGKKGQDKRAQKLFTHLVKKGADVRMWNHVGWSPVYVAVNANSPTGVQMLVKAGADPDQKQNPHEVAHHTLSPQRINYLTSGFGVNEEETPLTTAAIYAKDEVATALLKAGANPKLANAKGETPRQKATQLQKQLSAKSEAERNPAMEESTKNILKLLKGK